MVTEKKDQQITKIEMVNLDLLEVGNDVPLFGMITSLSEKENRDGYLEMELNEQIIILINNRSKGEKVVTEGFKKNNPNDPSVINEDYSLSEVIQQRMGETGIFISTLLEKEPTCIFLCKLVIFGKKQDKFYKFNN